MSKNHDVNFPPHARLTGYEVHKGNLTMYDGHGDAFHTKLKGHNQLNDESRLDFSRGRHGWEVHIQPKNSHGHGHGGGHGHHDGDIDVKGAIIIGSGAILGKKIDEALGGDGTIGAAIGTIGGVLGDRDLDRKDKNDRQERREDRNNDRGGKRDKHDKHSSLSGEEGNSIQDILEGKSKVLLGANFADKVGDPDASTSDLVASNVSDMTPAEMGDVPSELTMDSPALKQSATVTA